MPKKQNKPKKRIFIQKFCDGCIERTLHQQFAENYNNISGSLMTFVAAMLIVFTGYAYVFTNIKDAPCIFNCLGDTTKGLYSINALFWANLLLNLSMFAIFYFAVNLGLTQRKEQFVTYSIRKKVYGVKRNHDLKTDIFPKGYHPFGKRFCDFLVGIYGYIANSALFSSVVSSFITLLYIGSVAVKENNCCQNNCSCTDNHCCLLCYHICFSSLLIVLMLVYKYIKYNKYKHYESQYNGDNN